MHSRQKSEDCGKENVVAVDGLSKGEDIFLPRRTEFILPRKQGRESKEGREGQGGRSKLSFASMIAPINAAARYKRDWVAAKCRFSK